MQDTLPAWTRRAALIYGPRKAGTTLLLNLLDGTDALLAFPSEIKLKALHKMADGDHTPEAYLAHSRISEVDTARLSHGRYRAFWAAVDSTMTGGNLRTLLQLDVLHLQQSSKTAPRAPQIWCAKEVGGDTDSILSLWRRCFSDAPVLFILRDPLMVTRSVLNDRRRKQRWLSVAEIVRETADPMRVTAAQGRHLSDPHVFAVAYEDVVADTATAMRRIAGFLGIPFEEILLRPTQFGAPVVVRTSSRSTTEVFEPASDWRIGLTRRERFWVSVTASVLGLLPRYRVDYAALRQQLNRLR